MKKIAVIVGHEKTKAGARLNLNDPDPTKAVHEYGYNLAVAKLMEQSSGAYSLQTHTFLRDGIGLNAAYLAGKVWGADLFLELHFNSAADGGVKGAEILCSERHKDSQFPLLLLPKLVDIFGGKNRGIKSPVKGVDRGYGNVNRDEPYFLLEPFFGSSLEQAKIAEEKKQDYAVAILDALKSFFLTEPKALP